MREGPAEDEAARFNADDHVDPLGLIALGEGVDDESKRGAILQKSRDVLEQDALSGKVFDVTDFPPEAGDVHRPLSYLNAAVR